MHHNKNNTKLMHPIIYNIPPSFQVASKKSGDCSIHLKNICTESKYNSLGQYILKKTVINCRLEGKEDDPDGDIQIMLPRQQG